MREYLTLRKILASDLRLMRLPFSHLPPLPPPPAGLPGQQLNQEPQ
jgi:hypothetical protein